MRKLADVVASVLAMVGTALGAPAAWAGHGDKLVVVAKLTDFEKKDHGKEGVSEGDELVFEYDLFDKSRKKVGDGAKACELTKVDRDEHEFEADCEALFELEDGDIETEGEVTHEDAKDGKIVLDITGGSGDFKDADGKAVIEPLHRDHAQEAGHRKDLGKEGDRHGHHRLAKVTFHFE